MKSYANSHGKAINRMRAGQHGTLQYVAGVELWRDRAGLIKLGFFDMLLKTNDHDVSTIFEPARSSHRATNPVRTALCVVIRGSGVLAAS